MIQNLTIAYITGRKEPQIDWFLDSLDRQISGSNRPRIVVVDAHKETRALETRGAIHVSPKPTVWQGPHRVTSVDWWATANARNTGLCFASTPWLAYVDDLSVLGPRWLEGAMDAMKGSYFAFGAYKKVKNLVVEKGDIKRFDLHSQDSRIRGNNNAVPCPGSWLYGCSLVGRTEHFLQVGGWPELCDGMGYEDVIMGITLGNNGFTLRYDERMLTLESEDQHASEQPYRRTDKGTSPNDKSHAILEKANAARHWDNPIQGGIRAAREKALKGEPFDPPTGPTHDWYDQQPIAEMI